MPLLLFVHYALAGLSLQSADYRMAVTIAPETRRLAVAGTLTLQAQPQPRDSIKLMLWSELKDVSFSAPGYTVIQTPDSVEGDRTWTLHVRPAFAADRPVVVGFTYRADSASAPQVRVTPSSTVAGGGAEAWYPRLAFDSLATGSIDFDVPHGYTVLASGTLIARRKGKQSDRITYRIDAPTHITFAAARYTSLARGRAPVVAVYSLQPRATSAAAADRAAHVVQTLSRLFGPLPESTFSVAEVEFGGSVAGIGAPSFFLASPGTFDRGLPLPFVAHEIGHAWWGGLIGTAAGVGRMMLTEGNASFGMLNAIAAIEGDSAADAYRAGRYPGYLVSGSPEEYLRMAAAGLDLAITGAVPKGNELMIMHRVVNTKGMLGLDMLAREIGQDAFSRALAGMVRRYSGKQITWQQYRTAIEAEAGRDLGWFFDQWFGRTGAPEFHLNWTTSRDSVFVSVSQSASVYRTELEVEIVDTLGKRSIHVIDIEQASTRMRYHAPHGVEAVRLDPRFRVLRWTAERRERAHVLAPYTRAEFQRRFGNRDAALKLFEAARDSLPQTDRFGARFLVEYGWAQALYDRAEYGTAASHVQTALIQTVRDPDLLPWAYVLAARIAQKLGRALEMDDAKRAALAADRFASAPTGAADAVAGIK